MFFVGTATRHGGRAMCRCYSGMFETNSANLIGDFVFGPDWFCRLLPKMWWKPRLHLRQAHEFVEDHALRPWPDDFPLFHR